METDWIGTLLNTKFFTSCDLHPTLRKNEKNKFCIDCSISFCKNCRVHDLHRQTYKVNGEVSVHLNSRRQSVDTKSPKAKSRGSCEDCGRHVQDPYRFCSVACKVSVNSVKVKGQSIGTIISPSLDFGNLSYKERTSPETNASELESTISIAESIEEIKASPSSSRPRKRRRKGIPHRSPF
ncbi:uncharacterized protein LOC111015876 isoform X2 [Momordica charantia]|uniref:Uncharacterized protein LOC111015876 isoform X2 n=1 Tax=Momordica charantia TaxID=3673 RepID=A0A6J1D0E9_MOMCH|nr:uncharacterized protein LOC111015876 isoform X2 [Momordica charantia]